MFFGPFRPRPLFLPFWDKIEIGKLPVVSEPLADSRSNSTTGIFFIVDEEGYFRTWMKGRWREYIDMKANIDSHSDLLRLFDIPDDKVISSCGGQV